LYGILHKYIKLNRKEEENGTLVQVFIYRAPKKNHDAMVQLNKHCTEFFRKHGILRFEVFHLSSTDIVMDFVSIAETLSATQDEEVWMEIQSYRDHKHLDEFIANMKKDKIGESLYQEYLDLITPASRTIMGGFTRLS
jgi:uncharacterized protein YbaA (DUF1428 family)